jgi:hypothetical protein
MTEMLDGFSTNAGWSAYEMLLLRVPQLVHPSNVAVRRAESSYHLDLMGLGKSCYQEALKVEGVWSLVSERLWRGSVMVFSFSCHWLGNEMHIS